MKIFLNMLVAIGVATAITSCNGNAAKTDETTKDTLVTNTTTAMVTPSATPEVVVPFDVIEVRHTIKDYATWKPIFEADSANRAAAGLQAIALGRIIDKPNDILIVMKTTDIQKAKDFSTNPVLKATMDKAGVISKPTTQLWHIIRFNPDSKEKQWVEVTHKVKDFDAWLKVYDAEGKDKRMSEGMVDVALGRGIDDSNMVKIVFDITDMAKAKAAIASDEKKKLMQSAGVIGIPDIKYYTKGE
ncbi:MAG: hypothetical protein ABI091_17300 [Ferruginibacter sp.]